MNNDSILDKIISSKQASNIQSFKPEQTLEKLLGILSTREQDIIKRRFGLDGQTAETLEKIGQTHKITRERVRQLTLAGISKIKKSNFFADELKAFKDIIVNFLEESGGVSEENALLDALINLIPDKDRSDDGRKKNAIKNGLLFIIEELMRDVFDKISESGQYNKSWKLKYTNLNLLDKINDVLFNILKTGNSPLKTNDLVGKMKERILEIGGDAQNLAEDALISYFRVDRRIKQNIFGEWGLRNWNTISPKRMNDKIYLVLKMIGKPLHYRDIAKQINESRFDKKIANAETIHNELIMDHRYVLVGRGIYALKEWGYKKGTVADIIVNILNESDKPLSRQEIIEKVLKQRIVKKATIQLALMNKSKFRKLENGEFDLNKEGN